MTDFPRITRDPAIMDGKACIRGMRVTVGMILGNLGAGVTIEELLAAYPYLDRNGVLEAIRYGAWLASERESAISVIKAGFSNKAFDPLGELDGYR